MGVHGLWELLSPVGRRVSVETLAGKRLAIDASIWMVQFMKAMRDERGEMVRNGHLLGFFRRICKLLFLRTKPVFVFDGATPDLKRKTVAARRRHRDSAQAKVRKTAEKLLLNHLKAMKLQELADNIKNQRRTQKNGGRGKKVLPDQSKQSGNKSGENGIGSVNHSQGKRDEMFAASVMTEEDESVPNNSAMSDAIPCIEDDDEDEDEEMILPDMIGEVDPAVLASLTPSLQLDLLQKQKRDNDVKGKKIMFDNSEKEDMVSKSFDQEKIDEMLAASLMEEEKRSLINNASTSNSSFPVEKDGNMDEVEDEDEDEDEDEEMIVPPMDGGVDPSILASLPPSMQLDLLVQIRERLMAENRQKYQKVKKDPGKFSELQIQAYLKTVAFRREIDQVQKAASGRGVGGVLTSRIASEANREFIFSSSFTGDKQELVSDRAEKCGDKQQMAEERSSTVMLTELSTSKSKSVTGSDEHPSSVIHTSASASKSKPGTGPEERSSSFMRTVASTSKSKTTNGSEPNRVRKAFDDSIETYLDEQGRVRVSRVRAMGIRMTRDLQRNLDLMKEIEQERENVDRGESNSAVPTSLSGEAAIGTSHDVAESIGLRIADENSVLNGDASIEISFEDDGDIKGFDGDDDIFNRLAAETPVGISSDNINSKQSSASDSDCDWEEGTVQASGKTLYDDANLGKKPFFSEGYNSDGSEVEWEEGGYEDSMLTASPFGEKSKLNSKGYLVEEAELQEAIRRSLGDLEDQKSDHAFPEDVNLVLPNINASKVDGSLDSKPRTDGEIFLGGDGIQQNMSTCEILYGVGEDGVPKTADALGSLLKSSIVCNPNEARPPESHIDSPKQSMQDANKCRSLSKKSPDTESLAKLGVKEVSVGDQKTAAEAEPSSYPSGTDQINNPDLPFSDDQMNELIRDIDNEEKLAAGADQITIQDLPFSEEQMMEVIQDIDNEINLASKKSDKTFQEVEHILENSALEEDEDWEVEATEAQLEEELKILSEERLNLGDERRRLERNAESVSGEMFIECQELLQMFGIPYIISPMEAEAQCAFLEIANLVDGVVTDDSDVFLFGAQSVYKNIFDDRKYVETYFMKDIENEFGLSREKLISMALLLGSDYTEGVSGIGIVNAVEVLNAFPKEDGLKEFREWIESPDPTILGKLDEQPDSKVIKKGSKSGKSDSSQRNMEEVTSSHENSSEAEEQKQSADDVQEAKKMFMDKHRKVSKNWHMPPSFPSEMVISAYLSPEIDKSTEPFSWGKPDHFVLRRLCWEKFGWDSHKADELILPVLKEYNKRETQLRMEAFYTFNERFAKIRSKRIKKAVKGITGKKSSALMDDSIPKASGSKNKRKSNNAESGDDQSENVPNVVNKSTSKQSRKRTKHGHGNVSDGTKKRTRTSRKGKGKESSTFEVSETSSYDDEEVEVLMETRKRSTQEGSVELRRSRRARKPVDYVANDSESEDLNHSVKEGPENITDKEASYASELTGSGPHFAENVSPEKGLEPDCCEKGGGFCLDDGDNDQPGSVEYLQTGGGFYLDEDETHPDENSTDVVIENANLSQCSDLNPTSPEVSEPIINSPSEKITEQSKISSSARENDTDTSQRIPVGALRAMPRLRKKRKT